MKEIELVSIDSLKFDDDINQLVPEMTEEEFSDLVKSIEEEGQRTPIHINKDNTVLDGRHRVRALEELDIKEVSAIKENMGKDEALKFVRDTAVKRRNLTKAQILNIVLSTDDLVGDLQARAKENQKKSIEVADQANPKKQNIGLESKEPNPIMTTNTNEELGKIAGVSKATVQRAKKVKKENLEAYEKVVKGESTWRNEYDKILEKNEKTKGVSKVESSEKVERLPVKETEAPKPKKRDRREEINERADAVTPEEKNMMISETNAMNIISISDNLLHLLEDIQDLNLTLQFLKTQNKEDLEKIIKMHKGITTIIEKGDLQNV